MKEKTMRDGKMMLCEEIEKIVDKGKITMGDLEILYKLTDTLKNMLKIEMLEGEEEGYSERRDSRGRYSREGGGGYSGEGGGSYARAGGGGYSRGDGYDERGNSYARRGEHYVRAHYSREGGYSGDDMGAMGRETRGGYSRAEGKDRMMHELGELMEGATDEERRTLERAMMILRKA